MKYYRIADLTVEMNSFGKTAIQAMPYEIDGECMADIVVSSEWERFKEKNPHVPDENCEYFGSAQSFYRQLVNFDGLVIHASSVMMDGRAYLFSAPSGTGKSTHTRLWLAQFGERAAILNDDKPALRRVDGRWYAYGTPWSGKHDISINTRVPLAGICVLRRGEINRIERYNGPAAVHALLEQTTRARNPEFMGKMLVLLDKLLTEIPVWRMECNMAPDAAIMSHKAMSNVTAAE